MDEVYKVVEVVWLENPHKYEYLRETTIVTDFRSGKPSKNWSDLYRIVGYENVAKAKSPYYRRVWWLKTYDRGCPKEYEGYRKGIPTEAVLTKNIKISKDVYVLEAYKIKKVVKEVKNVKEENRYYNYCAMKHIPFIIIKKARKYGYLMLDMPFDKKLTNNERELLLKSVENMKENLKQKYGKNWKEMKDIIFKPKHFEYVVGNSFGYIEGLRIYELRMLASEWHDILKEYWG